nr:retrovirus-related Pol polyprotein from transposon TNT 1-94 [Tanacetum cinerariifolium]
MSSANMCHRGTYFFRGKYAGPTVSLGKESLTNVPPRTFPGDKSPGKPIPSDKSPGKAENCRWGRGLIYHIKNKERLVTQGYNQEEGINSDETFAAVARLEETRNFLAFAIYMNFIVYQMDVKNAFLNGKLKEEVYVQQPPSFESTKTPMVPLNNLGPDLNGKAMNETRYFKGIPSLGHWYPKCLSFDLKEYSDSNYDRCNMDRKSTPAEVEYVADVGYYAHILWMKSQLSDYDIVYEKNDKLVVSDSIFTKPFDELTFKRLIVKL